MGFSLTIFIAFVFTADTVFVIAYVIVTEFIFIFTFVFDVVLNWMLVGILFEFCVDVGVGAKYEF